MSNPFTLTFGKKPTEYIIRNENIDQVLNAFMESPARYQTYLIRGVRGSGKTVLMTAISQKIEQDDDWICVDLNPTQNLIDDFAYRLSDACRNIGDLFERGVDISVAGFGIGVGGATERDSVSKAETILRELKKKGKKILITIDEVENNQVMKQFASQFQIWIRKDFPLFLLMTGLFENIDAIQNSAQLTFLLRSPKITVGPLGLSQIARQYESALSITGDLALNLAKQTKGYAFAFQALGMIYWDSKDDVEEKKLLRDLDSLLDEYVYHKIWNDLSELDQKILMNVPDNCSIKTGELCEKAGITPQVFSKYRERLIGKGLIVSAGHGYVELALPRFGEVCKLYRAILEE